MTIGETTLETQTMSEQFLSPNFT